ncbi:hypothetical protein Pelo_10861 [Pelomyxa schiedti]|nr:hypothetical protein Pelo_10861 [Pelomyxa schiedti]
MATVGERNDTPAFGGPINSLCDAEEMICRLRDHIAVVKEKESQSLDSWKLVWQSATQRISKYCDEEVVKYTATFTQAKDKILSFTEAPYVEDIKEVFHMCGLPEAHQMVQGLCTLDGKLHEIQQSFGDCPSDTLAAVSLSILNKFVIEHLKEIITTLLRKVVTWTMANKTLFQRSQDVAPSTQSLEAKYMQFVCDEDTKKSDSLYLKKCLEQLDCRSDQSSSMLDIPDIEQYWLELEKQVKHDYEQFYNEIQSESDFSQSLELSLIRDWCRKTLSLSLTFTCLTEAQDQYDLSRKYKDEYNGTISQQMSGLASKYATSSSKIICEKLKQTYADIKKGKKKLQLVIETTLLYIWAKKKTLEWEAPFPECTQESDYITRGSEIQEARAKLNNFHAPCENVRSQFAEVGKTLGDLLDIYRTELQFEKESAGVRTYLSLSGKFSEPIREMAEPLLWLHELKCIWNPKLQRLTALRELAVKSTKLRLATGRTENENLRITVATLEENITTKHTAIFQNLRSLNEEWHIRANNIMQWMMQQIAKFAEVPKFDSILSCVIAASYMKQYYNEKNQQKGDKEKLEKIFEMLGQFNCSPSPIPEILKSWQYMENLENSYSDAANSQLKRQIDIEYIIFSTSVTELEKSIVHTQKALSSFREISSLKEAQEQEQSMSRIEMEWPECEKKVLAAESAYLRLVASDFSKKQEVQSILLGLKSQWQALHKLKTEKAQELARALVRESSNEALHAYHAKSTTFCQRVRDTISTINQPIFSVSLDEATRKLKSIEEAKADAAKTIAELDNILPKIVVNPPNALAALCEEKQEVTEWFNKLTYTITESQKKCSMISGFVVRCTKYTEAVALRKEALRGLTRNSSYKFITRELSESSTGCARDCIEQSRVLYGQIRDLESLAQEIQSQDTEISSSKTTRQLEEYNTLFQEFTEWWKSMQFSLAEFYSSSSSALKNWIKEEVKRFQLLHFDPLQGAHCLDEPFRTFSLTQQKKLAEKTQIIALFDLLTTGLDPLPPVMPLSITKSEIETMWSEMGSFVNSRLLELRQESQKQQRLDAVHKEFVAEAERIRSWCAARSQRPISQNLSLCAVHEQINQEWRIAEEIKTFSLNGVTTKFQALIHDNFRGSEAVKSSFNDVLQAYKMLNRDGKNRRIALETLLKEEEDKEELVRDLNVLCLEAIIWLTNSIYLLQTPAEFGNALPEILEQRTALEIESKKLLSKALEFKQDIQKKFLLLEQNHVETGTSMFNEESLNNLIIELQTEVEKRTSAFNKRFSLYVQENTTVVTERLVRVLTQPPIIAPTPAIELSTQTDSTALKTRVEELEKSLETQGNELREKEKEVSQLKAEVERLTKLIPASPALTLCPTPSIPIVPTRAPPHPHELVTSAKCFFETVFTNFVLDTLSKYHPEPMKQAELCKEMWAHCFDMSKSLSTNYGYCIDDAMLNHTAKKLLDKATKLHSCFQPICKEALKLCVNCFPQNSSTGTVYSPQSVVPGSEFDGSIMQIFPQYAPASESGTVLMCVLPGFANQKAVVFLDQV